MRTGDRSEQRSSRRPSTSWGLRVRTARLALVLTAAAGLGPARAAVFGEDDRGPVPAGLRATQEMIGLLYNGKAQIVCTAFCVAPDIVATAAHCLFRTAEDRPPALGDFVFAHSVERLDMVPDVPVPVLMDPAAGVDAEPAAAEDQWADAAPRSRVRAREHRHTRRWGLTTRLRLRHCARTCVEFPGCLKCF